MLISCYLFKKCREQNTEHESKELYKRHYKPTQHFNLLYLVAIVFLVFECILFYYAIKFSNFCSTNIHQLIINYIFSITFTTPYIFFNTLSKISEVVVNCGF
jgi:hypothetical protein